MPYIDPNKRKNLDTLFGVDSEITEAGTLNYIITRICQEFIKRKGKRYEHYNMVVGALESAKLEFYHKAIRPYEDIKIKENGDVY